MKNTIIMGLFIATLTLVSCSKDDDFTDPDNLSGTEWKSTIGNQGHYFLLKFTGKTSFELYEYEPLEGLDVIFRGSYNIDEKNITLQAIGGYIYKGIINGNKLTLYDFSVDDEIFTKQ